MPTAFPRREARFVFRQLMEYLDVGLDRRPTFNVHVTDTINTASEPYFTLFSRGTAPFRLYKSYYLSAFLTYNSHVCGIRLVVEPPGPRPTSVGWEGSNPVLYDPTLDPVVCQK